MYPEADIPVLQMSLPTLEPDELLEHFAPMFLTSGASGDPAQTPAQPIDGFRMGLAKRSFLTG